MKNPYDISEYTTVPSSQDVEVNGVENPQDTDGGTQNTEEPQMHITAGGKKKKQKKKFSGAYYYVNADENKLREAAFARTLLTVIAFMLQIIVLLLPQGGLEYITTYISSYAYTYMWIVFVMIAVSVWLFVMNAIRYKIIKRIPKEYAPRKGFKRRAYFGAELYIAVNAVLFVIELSFVCIYYDGWGLAAMFICLLATAAAVAARQITHIALRNSELVAASDSGEARTE